jgi:hypothetical protein
MAIQAINNPQIANTPRAESLDMTQAGASEGFAVPRNTGPAISSIGDIMAIRFGDIWPLESTADLTKTFSNALRL